MDGRHELHQRDSMAFRRWASRSTASKLVRRPGGSDAISVHGYSDPEAGVFEGAPEGLFAQLVYDSSWKRKAHGLIHDGEWFVVGTAEAWDLRKTI